MDIHKKIVHSSFLISAVILSLFSFTMVLAQTTSWLSSGDQLYTASQVRKVGIGTTAPDFPLTLQAFVGADPLFSRVFSFQDQNGVRKWHLNFLNGGLNFVQSGVADYRLFLAQNGNVGVGLATPQAKLDVNGTVKVGSLTADPTGENGMIYYNNSLQTFRCYEAGMWKDCF